jgi:hypothetical protein
MSVDQTIISSLPIIRQAQLLKDCGYVFIEDSINKSKGVPPESLLYASGNKTYEYLTLSYNNVILRSSTRCHSFIPLWKVLLDRGYNSHFNISYCCTLERAYEKLTDAGIKDGYLFATTKESRLKDLINRPHDGGLAFNVGLKTFCGCNQKSEQLPRITIEELIEFYKEEFMKTKEFYKQQDKIKILYTCTLEEAIYKLRDGGIQDFEPRETIKQRVESIRGFDSIIYKPQDSFFCGGRSDGEAEMTIDDLIDMFGTQKEKKMNQLKVYKKTETIEGMKQLICEYSSDTHKFDVHNCCLCKLHLKDKSKGASSVNCVECPWMIIMKKACVNIERPASLDRISQLVSWIKQYEEAEEIALPKFEPFDLTFKIDSKELAGFWLSMMAQTGTGPFPGSYKAMDYIEKELEKCGINHQELKDVKQNPFTASNKSFHFDSYKDRKGFK